MSVFSRLLHRGTAKVALTNLGKTKHDQYGEGGLPYDILVYLNDNGDSSVREIASSMGKSESTVKGAIKEMEKNGWVEIKGSDS